MTNLDPESVEPTPEAAADETVVRAPEAPAAETSAPAPWTPMPTGDAPKKKTGLIVGVAALVVLVIAGLVVGGLALGGVFKDAGNPETVVKNYFAARSCAQAQAQLSPGEWAEMSATSGSAKCQDTQVKTAFSAITVAIKSSKVTNETADVEVTVTSSTSSTPQNATINLIQVDGKWKIDHIIAKSS